MAGTARAGLFIRRVGGFTTGIPRRRDINTRQLPEKALDTPEAAHAQHDLLVPVWKRRMQRVPSDRMDIAGFNRDIAARQYPAGT